MNGGRELSPGEEIGGYAIEAVAGRGGMGLVYRARQRRPERTVAIKVVSPAYSSDADFRARFERESNIAAQIEHPNVIPVYEVGEEDGLLYISMRFVDGLDLSALRRRSGRIPMEAAVRLLEQVAAALDAAHARGLVHRDVKPGNVLIAGGTFDGHAYLTDFGLTKRQADSQGMTATGAFLGTVDYVAPEQVMGRDIDARADIYALGCVLYELLAGTVPFARESEVAKIFAHVNEAAPPLDEVAPDTPSELAAVVSKAMAKDPAERFLSAGAFADAARAALAGRLELGAGQSVAAGAAAPRTEGQPTRHTPAGEPARSADTTRIAATRRAATARGRGRTVAIGAGVVVVVAAIAAIVALAGGGGAAAPSPERLARMLYAAINRSDDARVASLFTPTATIDNQKLVGRPSIASYFAGLPCGARITSLVVSGDTVVVRERLHDRPGSSCGSDRGIVDTATMTVSGGKLASWVHG